MITIPVEQIHGNPWQTRTNETEQHIAEIAQSIADVGLLQVPIARRNNGHVELAFGHTRLEAWKRAKPGQPFPVEIRELSDRAMSDLAAEENARRKNLSAIETAAAIARRIKDFQLTQVEAAKPFGYTVPGSISNLLRLLNLPQAVQQLVHKGELPERHARQLATVSRLDPKGVEQIAKHIAKDPEHAESVLESELHDLLERKATSEITWELSFPDKPVALSADKPATDADGDLVEIPACAGCPFLVQIRGWNDLVPYCARPLCFERKTTLWKESELARVAKQTKLAIAVPGEEVSPIEVGKLPWQESEALEKLIKKHPPYLRLVPAEGVNRTSRRLLGSEIVALATTDAAALRAAIGVKHEAKRAGLPEAPAADETDAQRAKRVAQEEKERAERRAEQSALRQAEYDIAWMAQGITEWLAPQIDARGATLRLLAHAVEYQYGNWSCSTTFGRYADAIGKLGTKDDKDLRRHTAIDMVADAIFDSHMYDSDASWHDWKGAQESVTRMLSKTFDLKPPRGWNEPPVHRTPTNCWQCGRFAPGDKLTKRDIAEDGWIDEGKSGTFCSLDHQEAFQKTGGKVKVSGAAARAARIATKAKPANCSCRSSPGTSKRVTCETWSAPSSARTPPWGYSSLSKIHRATCSKKPRPPASTAPLPGASSRASKS